MARGRGLNFSTKGLTIKNIAFVGGLMTFTFLAYAFIAPRLVTPTPLPPPEAVMGPSPAMPPMGGMGGSGAGMIPPGNIVSGQYARSRAYPGYGRFKMGRRINVS